MEAKVGESLGEGEILLEELFGFGGLEVVNGVDVACVVEDKAEVGALAGGNMLTGGEESLACLCYQLLLFLGVGKGGCGG